MHLWIEEMKLRDDNQVILYKPQGKLQLDTCNLTERDFILVLQTPLQAEKTW